MKLQELLDQYPRVKVSNPNDQEPIFSLIDQTSITSEALQISFERKPDFYHFLKAQGDHAIVFKFVNKDGTAHGFAASTFRRMCWNGQPICIGYTSDLRTTPQLDREARLQWRKFYGHGVGLSQEIEEFDNCIGFVTAVWNENKLAQKALVSTKKRPGDFNYDLANTYHSQSIWGRWRPIGKPATLVRPIKDSEMDTLHKLLCNQDALSWNEDDLKRSLSVFQKTLKDFQVLEENGLAKAFVLPVSTSKAKKTLVKKWPPFLKYMAKLLPVFGKRKVELNVPIEVLQLMLFKSVMGDEDENLGAFVDHFWYQNNQLPKSQQFSILAINRWDKPNQKSLHLKEKGYLFTSIEGALYKVTAENTSPVFKEINDFSHLEVGFMTDWAAKWFEVRAEMGQSDIATMMYQDKDQPIKKVHFHHREADGFGKIQSLLRNEGITIQAPIRPLKKPSSFLHFYLLIKGMVTHPRLPHNPWKTFSLQFQQSGQPDEVSFWFLSKEENQKLKSLAKEKNLNLGFFLLSELDQIIKKQLYQNPEDSGFWLCPVDLRGAYPNAPAGQNFVSFVVAEIKGINNSKSVQESFEKYKSALRTGAYWAFWELAQIGRWVGLKGMKYLAKQGTNKHFWMGSFSDLGVWNQEVLMNSKVKDRHWVIAPPGSPSYPIGITTIEWCGNRSITMKIHPAICNNQATKTSTEILEEFKKIISK